MQAQEKSRLGFYYPDKTHQKTLKDLHNWLEQINGLPANWVMIKGSTERAVPESFIHGLQAAGLEPIVQIPCQVGAVRPETLHPLLYSYAHWGLNHVIIYDRPNLKQSWAGNAWANIHLTERFVDALLPSLQAAYSAGLTPTLPPLEPGGDYWDTAFLKSTLKAISRRGQQDLVDALVLSAYALTEKNKLDWGRGGPEAWPTARPYFTPQDSQDHQGFHIFEWYRAVTTEALGNPRPVLALQNPSATDADSAGETAATVAQILHDPSAATGLQAFIFCGVPDPDHRSKWHKPDRAPKSQVESKATEPMTTSKRLAHYLLIPGQEQLAVPIWRRASAFALTHQPAVGFSIEEAYLAQKVTIAADYAAIPAEVDQKLQAAGCQVDRLSLLPQKKSACNRNEVEPRNV